MTRIDPELERTVRSWLQDGVDSLPDHVFDGVVDGYPTVRQRRLGWWPVDPVTTRRLLAVAAVVVLAVTLVGLLLRTYVGDDDDLDATWNRLPTIHEAPLPAGRVLVDDPFPVRIGLAVPEGWSANPTRATLAQIGRDAGGASLMFTVVEAVYADPCHNDAGLLDPPVGPGADALATALAAQPGLTAAGPFDTTVDGRPAVTVTLSAPAEIEGCTAEPLAPLFKVWGVPEWHWLDAGSRDRLWIMEVGDTRLVISAEEYSDSTPEALAELNAIVASIEIDPVVDVAVDPSQAPAPSVLPLPPSGELAPGEYVAPIQLHRYADGVRIPLDGRHRVTMFVEELGWSSSGDGIQRPAGDPTVGYAAWSIGRIYKDPCHWQADEPGLVDTAELETMVDLANALSRWWTVSPPRVGFDPPPNAPLTTEPMDVPRFGRFGRFVELTVPPDLDLETCDGGEYRLWEDPAGRPRLAREPGERIGAYVVDADPGVFVVDAWTVPAASAEERQALERHLNGVWLRDPVPATGE